MIRHGEPPFLECSGRGDKRFSAFYARIKGRGNQTIEQVYQSSKVFQAKVGGSLWRPHVWREAKGLKAFNQEEVTALYSQLWDEYMMENPELLAILKAALGLSDMFGKPGHCCQATELWRIRNAARP